MKNHTLFFLPAIGSFIISTILLTLPGAAFPKETWLDKIGFDKWVHIGMFGVITFLVCWGIYKINKARSKKLASYFIIAGALCLLYGIIMEFVQKYWVINRSFDIGDIIADGIGSALGGLVGFKRYGKK